MYSLGSPPVPPIPAFTVFDLETTGLDPRKGHRIIEIAAVRIENGIVKTDTPFESYVNPERPIPAEASQVNKITDAMVIDAPTIVSVLPQFLSFASGSVLVAHNALFDMGFLTVEKEFCWGYVELPECLCTMKLSQALFPHEFRHNLDALSLRLKLPFPANRHRALPDVLLAAQALTKMMEMSRIASLEDLRKKASIASLAKK